MRSFDFFLFGDTMRPRISFLLFWSLVASSATTTLADQNASGFIDIQAADVPYEPHPDVPELGYSVLSGDPAKAGVYVIRLKIPPGLTFPPHHHDQDRHITVISGEWAFGKGRSGSCDDTVSLTAGAYVMHPKEAFITTAHAARSRSRSRSLGKDR